MVLGDPVINMLVHVLPHALSTGTVSDSGQIVTHVIIDEDYSWLYANVVADTRAGSMYTMHTQALFFILCILNSVRYTHALLPSHIEVNAQFFILFLENCIIFCRFDIA